jgi:hypothetical protein
MATFRAGQIDEILNYDRAMNRIVLDNEIGQATRFNDQRNPPTNRDIKFEALLGTLVDALKAKIAEALTSIASQQYPKTDGTKVTALLGLDTGTKNATFKNMNVAAVKKLRKQQKDFEDSAAAVRRAERERRDHYSDDEEDAEDFETAVGDDEGNGEGILEEDGVVPADVTPAYSQYANQMYAFGKPFKLRIGRGGAGKETETQTDRTGLEKEKSVKQTTNATENILYEVVNQYNGIVDKILQVTQPDGRFASKRTTASSSVGYFADVLKGVREPLTHLIFELTQVHKPELASILNMMRSMNDVIDMSPPFQKIAVESYKSGVPDFQGLNSETIYIDADGYIADLKAYLLKVKGMLSQTEHQLNAVLFGIRDEKLQKSIKEQLTKKKQSYEKLVKSVEDEIVEVQARQRLGKELIANEELIYDCETLYEDLEEMLIEGPLEKAEVVATFSNEEQGASWETVPGKFPDEANAKYLVRLESYSRKIERRLKAIAQYKEKMQEENESAGLTADEIEKDPELDAIEAKLHQQEGKVSKLIKEWTRVVDITERLKAPPGDTADAQPAYAPGKQRRIEFFKVSPNLKVPKIPKDRATVFAGPKAFGPGVERVDEDYVGVPDFLKDLKGKDLNAYARTLGVSLIKTPGRTNEVIKDEIRGKLLSKMGFQIQTPATETGEGKGKGGAGGLADLLATRKPQYRNHRESQQYEFDKQHNELMANEREWQAKSNPPHTTPVGSLYPFYKKDANSMYSFPMKLKHDNAKLHPDDTQRSARGADVSLLQGPVGAPSRPAKMPAKKPSTVTHRTAAEATQNILQGKGKKNPKALHKLLFNDESNDPYEENDYAPEEGGMIPEESESDEEDRFRNKKLGPIKKKSARK